MRFGKIIHHGFVISWIMGIDPVTHRSLESGAEIKTIGLVQIIVFCYYFHFRMFKVKVALMFSITSII